MSDSVPEHLRLVAGSSYCQLGDCPLGTCNKKSFKGAQVWGLTEDDCLDRLRRHYTNSEFHWNDLRDKEDREEQVENARMHVTEEVATEEDVEAQEKHYEQVKNEKADKTEQKKAATKGGGKGLQKTVSDMQAQLCKLTRAISHQAMTEMKTILTFLFKRSANRWKRVSNSGPSTAAACFFLQRSFHR